ncbi:MAG: hypothetical protein IAI49_08500 [Candidatus Eremiobacteraeota bacterium]|nr:hypothetical protein [Candidatus Eremiobacteraeota bacterium]
MPAKPQISPFSTQWASAQSQPGRPLAFSNLGVVPDTGPGERDDNSLPLYRDGGRPSVPHVVHCSGVPYSAYVCDKFHMTGQIVRLPSGAFPAGDSDHHLSVEDDAGRRELDFYGVTIPSDEPQSPLDVLTAGQCPYDGDGTKCSGSTATDIATSLGTIDPQMILAGEADPHGTLPYAIATALLCASAEWVYPADYSDGVNTDRTPACRDHLARNGRPPEGVRYFLDVSDAEIDATANKPYDKFILRTLDREHFGGTVTDTNWSGAPGPALQFLRDGWAPVFREAGVPVEAHGLPVTTLGIDLSKKLKFCTNGTC